MSIYACFDHAPADDSVTIAPAVMTQPRSARGFHGIQLLLATAALVTICLLPIWQPARVTNISQLAGPPAERMGSSDATASPEIIAAELGAGLSHWLPASLPSMTVADMSAYSLPPINLIDWVPEEPMQTVRGIPATIESIQPYYRYSTELPVISQWSNGIHYTLSLIRKNLPIVSSDQPVDQQDLGWMPDDLDRRFLC